VLTVMPRIVADSYMASLLNPLSYQRASAAFSSWSTPSNGRQLRPQNKVYRRETEWWSNSLGTLLPKSPFNRGSGILHSYSELSTSLKWALSLKMGFYLVQFLTSTNNSAVLIKWPSTVRQLDTSAKSPRCYESENLTSHWTTTTA